MLKHTKIAAIIVLSTFLSILTFLLVQYISSTYFFDKFYYQKSITYGYNPEYKINELSKYGRRSEDLHIIYNPDTKILGAKDDSKYSILIIGDSFVWGQGIRNDQRFADILEKKLNKIRPTDITTLAQPGWNMGEFLNAYEKASEMFSPDLIIFALVHNDVLFHPENTIDQSYISCQNTYSQAGPTFELSEDTVNSDKLTPGEVGHVLYEQIQAGWTNPLNLCFLDSVLDKLPTEKSIYFMTDEYGDNNLYTIYDDHLKTFGKYIISSSQARYMTEYSFLWDGNPYPKLDVSASESHPNAVANRIYSDILFREITINPKWDFY